MSEQRIRIAFPDNEWFTSNGRLHWRAKAERIALIRNRAAMLARSQLQPVEGPVLVACRSRYRTGRGLDADACAPTLKGVIDGFTDAGIWADDDADHVGAICYQASRKDATLSKGWHALDIIITSQLVPF